MIDGTAFAGPTSPGVISISPDANWLAYQINRATPSGGRQSLWYLQSLTSTSFTPVLLGVHHDRWTLPAEQLAWGQDAGMLFFTVSVPLDAGWPGIAGQEHAATGDHADADWQARVYSFQSGMDSPTPDLLHIEATGRQIEQLYVMDKEPDPVSGRDSERTDTLLAAVAVSDPESGKHVLRWRELEPDMDSPDSRARARWLDIDAVADSPAQYVGVIRGNPAFLTMGARGTGAITLADERQSRVLTAETQTLLRSALVHGQKLVLEYLEHGSSTLRVVDLDGRPAGAGTAVYGGFTAPMETSFSVSRLVWLASGGAYAVAGPRGGGDYGEHWHKAGRGERRHNSIADVLASEAVHRVPAMFSALVTDAAVLDLVRLDALGGASFWQQEYRGFTTSPYQALVAGGRELAEHPPALLIVRETDPVVAPAHSFKYLQALQAKPEHPGFAALLGIVPGQGHDVSGRVTELIDDYALRWTFLTSGLVTGSSPD